MTVTAFDALAQQVAEHVKKGDQILVSGRLREECVPVAAVSQLHACPGCPDRAVVRRQWQDKATGQPRSKLSITAAKVASVAPR